MLPTNGGKAIRLRWVGLAYSAQTQIADLGGVSSMLCPK